MLQVGPSRGFTRRVGAIIVQIKTSYLSAGSPPVRLHPGGRFTGHVYAQLGKVILVITPQKFSDCKPKCHKTTGNHHFHSLAILHLDLELAKFKRTLAKFRDKDRKTFIFVFRAFRLTVAISKSLLILQHIQQLLSLFQLLLNCAKPLPVATSCCACPTYTP